MLQHEDAVGRGDGKRAPRSALADDRCDERYAQIKTGLRRPRDGLGLAAFFSRDTAISTRRIDERYHGQAETVRHFEEALCLAVSFRHRHAEIVFEAGFGVVSLLMSDHRNSAPAKARQCRYDCVIVGERTV